MKCPGQDSRNWGPEAIFEAECPKCGGTIEFFKDEGSRRCRKCGHKLLNPKMDFGCAAYCRFASECLGADMPPELAAKRADLLKDRITAEVKKALGRDFKMIGRLVKMIDHADRIVRSEKVDPAAVLIAARLAVLVPGPVPNEDLGPGAGSGSRGAEPILRGRDETGSHNSGSGPESLEQPGTITGEHNPHEASEHDPLALAADILERTGAPGGLLRDVLIILREVRMGTHDSAGARYVADAGRLALLEELHLKNPDSHVDASGLMEGLLTESGRELARQVLNLPPLAS